MLGTSSPSGSIIGLLEALSGLLEALSACWKHRCLPGLGRVEEIAAILQEFRLNESPSRGIAANLHHFRPFCFKPKRNGGNSCNFAGFRFWKSRPYRIAVFLQDFAYRIGVPGKIVEFADFACRMGVSKEMVQFSGWWKYPFSQQPDICRIS
ncbi:hypothetical protein [Paenibacillus dendritiformis]|uniref:hypothetical protein n=1 Tax=Paenibacillus dendritiformis TaxID=130049 RepID=UPI001BCD2696|nr:hypothetical protein [Paenibacillus dendritiformis]